MILILINDINIIITLIINVLNRVSLLQKRSRGSFRHGRE